MALPDLSGLTLRELQELKTVSVQTANAHLAEARTIEAEIEKLRQIENIHQVASTIPEQFRDAFYKSVNVEAPAATGESGAPAPVMEG